MKVTTDILTKLLREHGTNLLVEEQRLKAMLSDLIAEGQPKRMLLLSIREQIPTKLHAIRDKEAAEIEIQISSIKHRLIEEAFLNESAAEQIINYWTVALGWKEKKASKSNIQKGPISNVSTSNSLENTVTDIDGNVYHIVKIGTQEWMVENLKTTRYRNGDLIGTTIPATKDISTENSPKYEWAYAGNESNVDKFGRLYTWFVVEDKRGIAPLGWRVPTNADWEMLEKYLIGNGYNYDGSVYGDKIAKSLASKTEWHSFTDYGTIGSDLSKNNKSFFSAVPGGNRSIKGPFYSLGDNAYWWSSKCSTGLSWYRSLSYNSRILYANFNSMVFGFSIRCIKDY